MDDPELGEPPRRKRGGAPVTALLVLFAAAFLGWAALPLLGLDVFDRYTIAFVALLQYAVPVGVVLALVALVLRRWLTTLVVALAVVGLVAFVAPRAVPDAQPTTPGTPLRVLSLNTYFGRADAAQIVDLVRRGDVDVLGVQELTPELVAELDRAGLGQVMPHRVFHAGPAADGTGIASRFPLQELSLVPKTTLHQPSARILLPGGKSVEFVAVHPLYPVGADTADAWQRDLAALPEPPHDGAVRLVAGDFNATLDHTPLRALLGRGYRDAAEVTGAGLQPTWPRPDQWLPPPVTIDHVLVSGSAAVRDYRTVPVRGSDHRGILADVVVPR
ncbi:endonuclease/exonuclease/phosphatase family protein [Saccharopolyspora rosea]|uniref:Endonuclease/exonuclease/phosphatase family protein n=1 Tax=Saccharopolyspora rosea TaxID=524884 RepID=A0ABW3FJW2_9PSEU